MLNERKCIACGKWTDSTKTHCTHCNALTDPELIAEQRRIQDKKERTAHMLANESKVARKIKNLQESSNPFYRLLFAIGNILFTIYMAILSFIVWLIALISG